MQSRLGPQEAGPHGPLQLLADGGKFLQKEDIVPERADRCVFKLAPLVVLMSTFLLYVVLPAGPHLVIANLDVGIFFALAVSSLSVIGILMAGWASANKYSLIGGLRAAGQLIAYELPLVLAVVGVVIQAGTLNLQRHRHRPGRRRDLRLRRPRQPVHPHPVRRLLHLPRRRAGRAHPDRRSTCRSPSPSSSPATRSSTPASASSSFFIAEFATAVAFAGIAATLFLGGWCLPGHRASSSDAY